MNQQRNNSKLIYALSMLWGFLLISAQFIYFLGSTEGFENALEEMFAYLPVSVAILMLCWISGRSVTKTQINIEFTKRHFILIAILCLFFFPMGLFFLFGKIKYKELER